MKIFIFIFISFFGASGTLQSQVKEKPNIIYILADDLGYGDLKIYNPESKISTPNLDALARDGIKFTNAHASSSVCTPSRYSILTGRYPWRSRLQQSVLFGYDKPLIEKGRLTVASFLRTEGYHTAVIGKWNLGLDWTLKRGEQKIVTGMEIDYGIPFKDGPLNKGFDYFYGISGSLDMPPYLFIENNKVVKLPDTTKAFSMQKRLGPTTKDFSPEKVLTSLTQKAKDVIYSCAETSTPFFLYYGLPSPHTPIAPSDRFKGKSGITAYGDYVEETDWAIGEIIGLIDSLNLSQNTIIMFASDNGFAPYILDQFPLEKMGHYPSYTFRGYKSDIWEGGHRVPYVVKWPAKIGQGLVTDDLISLTDLFRTISDIFKVELPENAAEDSYSLLPDFLGLDGGSLRPDIVYASIDGNFSIQVENWKLIFGSGSGGWTSPTNKQGNTNGLPKIQLYNLKIDPSERMNVESQHPLVVHQLSNLMKDYIRRGRSTPGSDQQNEVEIDLWKEN